MARKTRRQIPRPCECCVQRIVNSSALNPRQRVQTRPIILRSQLPAALFDKSHYFMPRAGKIFLLLKSFPCDIFLGAHGSCYGMEAKYARLQKEPKTNPLVDRAGHAYVDDRAKAFRPRSGNNELPQFGARQRSVLVSS